MDTAESLPVENKAGEGAYDDTRSPEETNYWKSVQQSPVKDETRLTFDAVIVH